MFSFFFPSSLVFSRWKKSKEKMGNKYYSTSSSKKRKKEKKEKRRVGSVLRQVGRGLSSPIVERGLSGGTAVRRSRSRAKLGRVELRGGSVFRTCGGGGSRAAHSGRSWEHHSSLRSRSLTRPELRPRFAARPAQPRQLHRSPSYSRLCPRPRPARPPPSAASSAPSGAPRAGERLRVTES